VLIQLPRFLRRDFGTADRAAFVRYQLDPRSLSLYAFSGSDAARAERLFERFLEWQSEESRRNFQIGFFNNVTNRLLGCAGLRMADEETAVLGIELAPAEWGRFRLALDIAAA